MDGLKNLVFATSLLVSFSSSAAIVQLDFEGVDDLASVGNFYNGGDGTNYGIEFSGPTLGIIDRDSGGTGNFANEPSASTVMFFLNAQNAILNYAAGFDTGFSFFYSSSTAASVKVYEGLNATGSLLATLALSSQFSQNCSGDPTGQFCHWDPIGVLFAGTAKSIDFGGTANQTAFDDITFGTNNPGPINPVPLPAAGWLFGTALLGFINRKKVLS